MDEQISSTDKNSSSIIEQVNSFPCSHKSSGEETENTMNNNDASSRNIESEEHETRDTHDSQGKTKLGRKPLILTSSTPKNKDYKYQSELNIDKMMQDLEVAYNALKKKKKSRGTQEEIRHLDSIYEIAKEIKEENEYFRKELKEKNKDLHLNKKNVENLRKENENKQNRIKELEKEIEETNRHKKHAKKMLKNISVSRENSLRDYAKDKEIDSSMNNIANDSQLIQSQVSTPREHRIPTYSDIVVKKMNNLELFKLYTQLIKRRRPGDDTQAQKFLDCLEIRLEEAEQEIQLFRQQSHSLQQELDNYNTLHQAVKDQNQQLNQLIQEKTQTIQDYKQMIDEISLREVKLTKEVENYKKLLQEKDEVLKCYIDSDDEGTSKSNIQVILEKLHKIERSINIEDNTIVKQLYSTNTEVQINSEPSYSHVTTKTTAHKTSQKQAQQYSRSAVLIKRLPNTQMSINDIRIILTRETKDRTAIKNIYCNVGRDRNTLIVKSSTDDETSVLMKVIEETSLKDVVEITYKLANIKKLIILGIPVDISETDVINGLMEQYQTDIPIAEHKIIKRQNAKNYQLVIEVEEWIAQHLLRHQRILLGFISCRVSLYLPIIRCNKCQRYGHTDQNCRKTEYCQYCARSHKSIICPVRKSPDKHRCINCYGTPRDFPHSANSSDCPTFQYNLHNRNTLAQNNINNSIGQ